MWCVELSCLKPPTSSFLLPHISRMRRKEGEKSQDKGCVIGKEIGIVYLDFSKVFDTACHSRFLNK